MNKKVFAFCMAALLLTGCGSTAPAAENSVKPTADSLSEAPTAEQQETEDESSGASLHEDEVLEYYENIGGMNIDIPYPARLEFVPLPDDHLYTTNKISRRDYEGSDTAVLYCIAFDKEEYYSDENVKFQGMEFEELLEKTNLLASYHLPSYLNEAYGDYPTLEAFKIEKQEETELLGHKTLRGIGKVTIDDVEDFDVNIIINFSYVSDTELIWWCSFTKSNDQSALDEMQYLADLPITKAKTHE